MMPAIAARDIRVHAGDKVLLDIPSLTVGRGQWIALVGPNGAGKTTLLRTLAGDIRPDVGTVLLDGRDISALSAGELAVRRAVLSQHVNVSVPFSVYEVAAMGAGIGKPHGLDRIVLEKLARVGLEAFADRKITTLSGGEQQRAHFARVLVQLELRSEGDEAACLFLDEPTASLDMRHQITMLEMTKQLSRRGVAVITVIHDLNLAAMFAERVIAFSAGEIVADGAPAAVVTDAIVGKVFDVTGVVNQTPWTGRPFVIPHNASPNRQ
jgi:iron complex transport system ATP-binding protein